MPEPPVLIQIDQFCQQIDQSPCSGCDQCGSRCTAGISILESEFREIRNELARAPAAEVARVLGQDKAVTVPGSEFAYTACQFRDVEGGRCLIYPARPAICRLFGHVEWLPCPIGKVERSTPGAVAIMQLYAGQPRKTYDEWAAGLGRADDAA